jgi:uncharacterized protein GlcG (DUF336 family)
MNGAPTAGVDVAQALAATAATFDIPSAQLAQRFPGPNLERLAASLPYQVLSVDGGLPVEAGGIGIAGPPPPVCAGIAAAVAG